MHLNPLRPDPKRPNPKKGVGQISVSNCGMFVATKEDSMPTAVWIWDVQNVRLHSLLVHLDPG